MLTLYTRKQCAYCSNTKNFLVSKNINFREIDIDLDPSALEFMRDQGHRTVPQIYMDGQLFVEGGWQGLSRMSVEEILNDIEIRNTRSLGTI